MQSSLVVPTLERLHHRDGGASHEEWFQRLAQLLCGVLAPSACLSLSLIRGAHAECVVAAGLPPERARELVAFSFETMRQQAGTPPSPSSYYRPRLVDQWSESAFVDRFGPARSTLQLMGARDVTALVLEPAPYVRVSVLAGRAEACTLPSAARRALTRLALHVETAARIRLSPRAVVGIIDARGQLELDVNVPKRADRERLVEDVLCIEMLRTRAHRDDGDKALALWQALTAGNLSLREYFDTDGKRLYEVCENPPHRRTVRALTHRQSLIVDYASRGLTPKEIAYGLGFTAAYVSRVLGDAAPKLGLADGRQLVRVLNDLADGGREGSGGGRLHPAERSLRDRLTVSHAALAGARTEGCATPSSSALSPGQKA